VNDDKHRVQPFLHAQTIVLRAPTQAWSATSGSMGSMGRDSIDGVYTGDTRILAGLEVTFDGWVAEPIATVPRGADSVGFEAVLRHVDDSSADPHLRVSHRRTVTASGLSESIAISSLLDHEVSIEISVTLVADNAAMEEVKAGLAGIAPAVEPWAGGARWGDDAVCSELKSTARLLIDGSRVVLTWPVRVAARGTAEVSWAIATSDSRAVVAAAGQPPSWQAPAPTGNDRLDRWVAQALVDLDALRMTTTAHPADEFLAAGAPWFFTLFGRDSIWSARFLSPLGGTIAADTVRVLARAQGTSENASTAEQPGKIMHELRRGEMAIPGADIILPPLYYGTIDATALWLCLVCDAFDSGMPEREIEPLLSHVEAALAWMRDYGDADGDGLLEYIDVGGRGLANQGWKDSGDSVQWRSGELARAPIALCEVQAYAFEAATRTADLLDHFGRVGEPWRLWASRLRDRFNEEFWIDDEDGAYPAIALDADKRPVDSLTSNIGHLLGTGLLDEAQSAAVAARLVSPELNSGYGVRTMATTSAGYWPLSYHGGSVWAHDTAIAIRGLAKAGFTDAAGVLAAGLLAAADSFDYRMPELHSGDPADSFASAVPYPAACRPQAWSAAAAIAVYTALQDSAVQVTAVQVTAVQVGTAGG
jgi:glycogen debranching enzyme